MKYLNVTFVLLVTIFIYQSEAQSSSYFSALEREINGHIDSVQRFRENLSAYSDGQFDDTFKAEVEAVVIGIVNTLKDINKKVDLASQNGVDAEKCYESAASDINNAGELVISQLKECFESKKPELRPLSKMLRRVKVYGYAARYFVESLREMCEADPINEEQCISLHLLKATVRTQSYKNEAANATAVVDKAITKGFNDISICMESPLAAFKEEDGRIVDTADKCINSTQIENL